MKRYMTEIAADYAKIERQGPPKTRVGIVGEIYVKFAPLGNNGLEEFLLSEGCEPVVPGLTDFMIFKINNRVVDVDLYKGYKLKKLLAGIFQKYIEDLQQIMIDAVKTQPCFRPMGRFSDCKAYQGLPGVRQQDGRGLVLTAEMLELIHRVRTISSARSLRLLPNHVVGKGMIGF